MISGAIKSIISRARDVGPRQSRAWRLTTCRLSINITTSVLMSVGSSESFVVAMEELNRNKHPRELRILGKNLSLCINESRSGEYFTVRSALSDAVICEAVETEVT